MEPDQTGTHPFQHVRSSATEFDRWLTVADAVHHCEQRGLPRTPKTIRKWSARSQLSPDNADISVRREDTDNGFRWSIEASSLDRKIDEELEFEARKSGERGGTGLHRSEPVRVENIKKTQSEPGSNTSEPVLTSNHRAVQSTSVEVELRAQLLHTQEEVLFLRDELKHRRKTDEALASVIEAFRLNSESSKARSLEVRSEPTPPSWAGKPRHDVVHSEEHQDLK
jgi:hypothetical protein